MPSSILVADDEGTILRLIRLYLEAEGFQVETALGGDEALQAFHRVRPDLVVLDVMMPRVDGLEVCRRLRKESNVPVIMLTARTDDVDKIVGLELGADDYVTKPFNARELVARIKAVLRRTQPRATAPGETLKVGDVLIDPARHEVWSGERPVSVRGRAYELLVALARAPGRVLTRETLISSIWGDEFTGSVRAVDVHITALRHALADSGVQVVSVRGLGYKLVPGEDGP